MRVICQDAAPIVRASWMRGVSALPNVFAHESWIDELACDAQIAILLNYLRQHYAGQAPWPDLAAQVGRLRAETAQK
ncbi:hypothetical protein QZQ41_12645 [Serratia marcescens]|nr:hypothetical protein [Serratia marcescens]MDP8615449.1 hypothetical protein [Serratia marcescens]MDP8645502.1 hypothetical protein [Serratia marcescens]MDP8655441.1 hypothetical protein [Serratia marcescens]MDP8660404.1 hypothetical protein [Serratia marcescens]MDP8719650.1 hypothetical protein [Serratia marcescens]